MAGGGGDPDVVAVVTLAEKWSAAALRALMSCRRPLTVQANNVVSYRGQATLCEAEVTATPSVPSTVTYCEENVASHVPARSIHMSNDCAIVGRHSKRSKRDLSEEVGTCFAVAAKSASSGYQSRMSGMPTSMG